MTLFENIDPFFERYDGFGSFLEIIETVGSVFMVLLLIELLYDAIRNRGRGVLDSLANLSFVVVDIWLETTVYSLIFIALLLQIEPYAFFHIPLTPLSWIACLIVVDFTYYWMHRSEHSIRLLWTYHSVHHSSTSYNFTTAVRLFWFMDFAIWIFFVPMVLVGFNVAQILSCILVVFTYMTWIHTEKIGHMGWFEKVFNTPSFHRVHHGRNPIYIDKNYAGIFVLWDRLFGTYVPETEKVDFGVSKPINTVNPLKIGFIEYHRLFRDVLHAQTWRARLGHLFRGPGWCPTSSE